jgi:hypothetical protein
VHEAYCIYCNASGYRDRHPPEGGVTKVLCDSCGGTGLGEYEKQRMEYKRLRAERALDAAWEKNRY